MDPARHGSTVATYFLLGEGLRPSHNSIGKGERVRGEAKHSRSLGGCSDSEAGYLGRLWKHVCQSTLISLREGAIHWSSAAIIMGGIYLPSGRLVDGRVPRPSPFGSYYKYVHTSPFTTSDPQVLHMVNYVQTWAEIPPVWFQRLRCGFRACTGVRSPPKKDIFLYA